MNSRSSVISFLGACILVHLGITVLVKAEAKKIKVFIAASQSNIERPGQFRRLGHLGTHPEYGHLPTSLENKGGSWKVHDDVTIYWAAKEKQHGPRSVSRGAERHEIGPELMFGSIMEKHFDEPVLLIKTAWGGKSVWCDFR